MRLVMPGPRRSAALAAACLTLALAAAGCTDPEGGGDGASPTASPTTSAPASPSPSDVVSPTPDSTATPAPGQGDTSGDGQGGPADFPADTSPDTAEAAPNSELLLTDIRMGGHNGFDRVVFEFSGPGSPGWSVQYVPEAISDGSGLPVEIEGEGILQVVILGVRYPEEGEAEYYSGPAELRVGGTDEIEVVRYNSIFEGQLQAFIGTDHGEQPFRVFDLESPTRVVVEVKHDD